MSYWQNRLIKTQEALTKKSERKVREQLRKYYKTTMEKVLDDFEQTYNKLLLSIEEGREPTPADLYKLDKYWKAQEQLRAELRALGEREAVLMSKHFEEHFFDIYYSFAMESDAAYSTLDVETAREMLNQIWCADGKSWSERIWDNVGKLQMELNEGLIDCVVAGRSPSQLKKQLMERFGVSLSRADTLVRTEMAHIQTQAAKRRYEDYGLTFYEILGNNDDTCGNHGVDCHKLDGKRFRYTEMVAGKNAPPFHPNCKCCIVPVVETEI
jgi:SPP1 gp7 family putative phage head morphogenesis protein